MRKVILSALILAINITGCSKATQLYSASTMLNGATEQIEVGANNVCTGTEALVSGTQKLESGVLALVDGADKLCDGGNQLADGSDTLVKGIKKFNTEGINKICSIVNDDGKSLIRRIEKLEELSEEYKKFSSEKENEEVQFFSIMDSILKFL
jgi:putative membrane protein